MPAQDHPDGLWVLPLHGRDVEAELEPGSPPGHPDGFVAVDPLGQLLAVDGRRHGDPSVRVQVVDVGGTDQRVHRGVDRGGRAAPSMDAEVECVDHLVLALRTRVDIDQPPEALQPKYGQSLLGQGGEVAARTLDPQELHLDAGGRIDGGGLRRGVASAVVRDCRIGAQTVRSGQELGDGRIHAPHPAWVPPTRSATIRSAYPESWYAWRGSAGRPRAARQSANSPRTSV